MGRSSTHRGIVCSSIGWLWKPFGYDAKTRSYTSTFFDNAGNTGVFKAAVQGNTWTWTGDTEVAGKPLKERCTADMAGGWYVGKCEYSSDGTTWMPNFDVKNTKSK